MTWWSRLLRRNKLEQDLGRELQFHIEERICALKSTGLSESEARRRVRQEFGGIEQVKEECRDARGISFVDNFSRDLRYAIRMLRRAPLFTAAAVGILALGIGANTTVFTFIENILLRPLPVPEPEKLVSLNWGDSGDSLSMSYPNYVDFRDRNTAFSNLVAYRYNPANLSIHARENFRIYGYEATGNYFGTLGIKPALGRFFNPEEDTKPGANPIIVISHRYWQSHFASDPQVIGRSVKINGYPFTIIGVAPPSFLGTELIITGDFWVPMSMETEIEPGNDWLHARADSLIWVMGRLKPGVSRAQAESNLDQIANQLAHTYPNLLAPNTKFHLTAPGLIGNRLRKPIAGFGIVLTSLAAAGLLLACVNLAGMLLARAADRHREIGIRLAVGATKFQLLCQLMTESLLLAAIGGILGFATADIACRLFSSWHPNIDLPIRTVLYPDSAVLWFTAAVALAATILFGLVPALQAMGTDVIPSLKNEPISIRLRRWSVRDVLATGQIALSVILVICSVLVVRSLQHALSLNLGFNPNNAVSVSFDLRMKGYNQESSRRFDDTLLAKASELPGIQYAGIVDFLPLGGAGSSNLISRGDRPLPKPSERQWAWLYNISPGYLQAAGTHLLSGRDIDAHDREGATRVALVNEALARLLYGKADPLGKYVRLGSDSKDKGLEIIGVVETGKYLSLGEDPHAAVFLPIAQVGTGWTTLVARTLLPPSEAIAMLRKTILDLNPDLALFNAGSLKEQLAMPLFPARAAAIVLGVFGVIAMILAATGLFALMAYSVSRRTHEIGIRMALGAQPFQVVSSIFGRTLLLCAIGISLGTIVTLVAGKLLSAILYGFSPYDPVSYIIALLLMTAVALAASWNPATRAIRIDPAHSLREQ